MPLYDFENLKTGKTVEIAMTIAEMEQYVKDNPHMRKVFLSAPAAIDPVRLGVRKTDSGWKEVVRKVHETTPGSQLDKTSHF